MTYKDITLTIINKADPGKNPVELRNLNKHQKESLVKIYTHHHDGVFTGNDQINAKLTLETLANLNAWLACSCQSEDDIDIDFKNAPILYTKRTPGKITDGLTLMRATFRSPHHEECPFFRTKDSAATPSSKSSLKSLEQKKMGADELFSILKPIDYIVTPMDSEDDKHSDGVGKSRNRQTRMSRILLTAMEAAGLNLTDQRKQTPNRHAQLASLKNTFANGFFDKGKHISVGSFTETSLDRLAYLSIAIKKSPDWKKYGVVPQGFLIGLAKSIINRTIITIDNRELPIDTPIILSGQNPKGPYLVIVLVGCSNSREFFTPLRAFAQPVFSEHLLMPVDSDCERKTLRCLLDCQREKGFAIFKPVADETVYLHKENIATKEGKSFEVKTATNVRPDFILKYDSLKSIVVETMGYTTDVYLERKERTHLGMKELGDIVEHRPDFDSDQSFKGQL